jgi:ubiquinone/menaquinone biosynthesis C-methylase UbiE
MNRMTNKQNVIDYYQDNWQLSVKLWQVDKTYCIHHGLYEKGIHTHIQSVLNMNDFVAKLLDLNSKSERIKNILDAGSGIGGTIVHLAKKYPNINFKGITIIPEHIQMAKRFAIENQVSSNTDFLLENYLDTNFPSKYFDAIFSLESMNYTNQRTEFIREMHRILKPGGKLIIIDAFRTKIQLNPFLKNIYIIFCKGNAIPSIAPLKDFISLLNRENFKEIIEIDLTKNIQLSVIRGNLVTIPYLFLTITRKITKGKRYRVETDTAFPAAVSVFSTIIGLKKALTYKAITAIKNNLD